MALLHRGVGAMELVAMDMKLRGMYIARQLSFHGVSFKIEEIPIPKEFYQIYNESVKLVSTVFLSFVYVVNNIILKTVDTISWVNNTYIYTCSGWKHGKCSKRQLNLCKQNTVWRKPCGASSGQLISVTSSTSAYQPRCHTVSKLPEKLSKMERYDFWLQSHPYQGHTQTLINVKEIANYIF